MNAEKLQMYIFHDLLPSTFPYPAPIKIGYLLIFFGNGLRKKMPVIDGMLSFRKHWS